MRDMWIAAVFTGILALFAPAANAKNLIEDGGFESPPTGSGSFNAYNEGTTFGPWSVVGASGNVATVASGFMQNGFTFKSKSGKAWLDLTGTSNTATGVAQTIKTVPGTSYVLTFWVGNVYDPSGIFGTTSTVDVYDGSTLLLQAVNSKQNGSQQVWQKFSVTFTASAKKTTLSLINGDPTNDNTNGLDAISLAPAAEAGTIPLVGGLAR